MNSTTKKPIGVFCGTFDPVHRGHIQSLITIQKKLDLASVICVPVGVPVHRDPPIANLHHRAKMLSIVKNKLDLDWLSIDEREGSLPTTSFTYHTIMSLRNHLPQSRFALILGMDVAISFHSWHRWREIMQEVSVVVMTRPGPYSSVDLKWAKQITFEISSFNRYKSGCVMIQEVEPLTISASEIRQQLFDGSDFEGAIKYGLLYEVYQYIAKNNLYLKDKNLV